MTKNQISMTKEIASTNDQNELKGIIPRETSKEY